MLAHLETNLIGNKLTKIDWGFIKNKPFYDTRKQVPSIIKWEGNIEDKSTITSGDNITFVKISNVTPTLDEIIQGSYTLTNFPGDSFPMTNYVDMMSKAPEIGMACINVYHPESDQSSAAMVMFMLEDFDMDGSMIEKGVYVQYQMGMEEDLYVSSITIPVTTGELKTLELKYLPKESITKVINLDEYHGVVNNT